VIVPVTTKRSTLQLLEEKLDELILVEERLGAETAFEKVVNCVNVVGCEKVFDDP
jgi:hypothetical protein